MILPLLFALFHFSLAWSSSYEMEVTRTCEPIRIDSCKNIGYNVTGMPNFVGHDMQHDAQLQIQTFMPLIQYGCSSRLSFFLCSVYVPMCTDKVPQPIGPCRSLCESVQERCEPVLLEFGFQWPVALNCSQFPPVNNEKHMCMEGPQHEEQKPYRDRRPLRHQKGPGISHPRQNLVNSCRHLRSHDQFYYINITKHCVASCRSNILYSKENKEFAQVWVAVWTGICFLSTMFTLIMFFMNTDRFRFPEKIIILISWCYFLCSFGYLIRLIAGREQTACYWNSHFNESLLVHGGLYNINCTLVFTLLYYFGMASSIWWMILCLNWFLSAGLGWNMERFSTYFHLFAWFVPAVKTIAILVMNGVDADELTGICYVGNQDRQFLVRFVIVPSFTYLAVGVIFLVAGMLAIIKNKSYRTKVSSMDEKWETLMVRVGIFAVLYTVPAICMLVTNFYEFTKKDEWLAHDSTSRPNVELFTLKIFMSLVVGITTGVWLYTSRSPQLRRPKLSSRNQRVCNHQVLLGPQQKMTIV
ncbi:frizzled-4 [Parasteatoda tepidariorum]|uniref:frizzled-4 n=1 Tax=Parasteatoda tepidariorum TaxID=114398 RepID=UPI00077FDA8F|nr:frizzled-4 [Parasteatoda tepidariorum]